MNQSTGKLTFAPSPEARDILKILGHSFLGDAACYGCGDIDGCHLPGCNMESPAVQEAIRELTIRNIKSPYHNEQEREAVVVAFLKDLSTICSKHGVAVYSDGSGASWLQFKSFPDVTLDDLVVDDVYGRASVRTEYGPSRYIS